MRPMVLTYRSPDPDPAAAEVRRELADSALGYGAIALACLLATRGGIWGISHMASGEAAGWLLVGFLFVVGLPLFVAANFVAAHCVGLAIMPLREGARATKAAAGVALALASPVFGVDAYFLLMILRG